MRRLRVKLILPSLTEATNRPIKYSLFPPLGLATLAAFLAPDDEATLVDQHVEPLYLDDAPDLVIIQVYITNAYRAYRIADWYRARGIFVALGGLHVTALPEEAAVHADAIFLGPGEQTFPIFLRDLREGHPERVYRSTAGRTLKRLPPIRRDLIARRRYLVPNSLVVSRRCPQHCDFCYKDAFFTDGRSFYTQRVDDALSEIRGRFTFDFTANVLNATKEMKQESLEQMMGVFVSDRGIQMGVTTPDTVYRCSVGWPSASCWAPV